MLEKKIKYKKLQINTFEFALDITNIQNTREGYAILKR